MRDQAAGLGVPVSKAVERLIEEKHPELMAKFYPRIYESTGRYHSPKTCAAFVASAVAEALQNGMERTGTTQRLLIPSLEPMLRRHMPMFFIAPDLLEAAKATDFIDDINWTEMRLPYEEGIFILPRHAWVHPEAGEVSMIVWARCCPGTYPPPVDGIRSVTLSNTSMVLACLCPNIGRWYDSVINANSRSTVKLHNLFYSEPLKATRNVPLDIDLSEKDKEFIEELGVLTFGTFLAMNARPELVEHGKLLRRVGKADKAREFWSPNIIGPRFKLKREVPRIVDGRFVVPQRETGTHASPRLHWRRGHFRNQPYGAGRKERKTIWLEPMLVGAEP
jgi:hypothetical protein